MGASFVGIIGGVIVNVIFNKLYFVPKGIAYEEFNIYLVIILIMVALGLLALTNLIVGKRIKKNDFIGDMDI